MDRLRSPMLILYMALFVGFGVFMTTPGFATADVRAPLARVPPTENAGAVSRPHVRVLAPAQVVRQLTGAATLAAGQVSGADLGHLFDLNNHLYIVFGDSYGSGSIFPPGQGALHDWRSNTMAVIPSTQDFLQNGLQHAVMILDDAADHVCVDPAVRAQAAADNQQAPARWGLQNGAYGLDTCAAGYVWREACGPSDHVCVWPEIRTQAAADNQQAQTRKAPNGGAYGLDTCRAGYVWREACGPHAKELIPGAHQANDGNGEVTKIPTNGIAVGGTMFLHYMSVKAWATAPGVWTLNYSSLAYSDNQGQDWVQVPFRWAGKGNFGQVAFVRDQTIDFVTGHTTPYVYLFGIPAGRFGGVTLARVPATRAALLDPARYSYYQNSGGKEAWVQGTGQEWAATTIVPAPVGELSVMYNRYLGQWIMLYFDQTKQAIMLRDAQRLTGPWSSPQVVYTGGDIYGGYMHPSLVEHDGEYVYFTLSRWTTYQTYLMKVHLGVTPGIQIRTAPAVGR